MDQNNQYMHVAMLTAMWEVEKKDTLDFLIPSVQYAIGRLFSVGNKINYKRINEFLKSINYSEIHDAVLDKILSRLAANSVVKEGIKNNRLFFILSQDLSNFCKDFENREQIWNNSYNTVITALSKYLIDKKGLGNEDYSYDNISNLFLSFLEKNGLTLLQEIHVLDGITLNDTINYRIGQFILDEWVNNTAIFKTIEDFTKGLMISSAIPAVLTLDEKIDYSNVSFYFDSALLLRLFGYKTEAENNSAAFLQRLLNEGGASIKAFRVTYAEIGSILDSYAEDLHKPHSRRGQTLESFDRAKYTHDDVKRVVNNLTAVFTNHNVNLEPNNDNSILVIKEREYKNFIADENLNETLERSIAYTSRRALDNDVKAIGAIQRMRIGHEVRTLDNCVAIFVTTNVKLVEYTKKHFNKRKKTYPPIITDADLATILWIQNYSTHPDIPKIKLIEMASRAIYMTDKLKKEFMRKIDQMIADGAITNEHAARYRSSIYERREMAIKLVNGDADAVDALTQDDFEYMANMETYDHIYGEKELTLHQGYKNLLAEQQEQHEEQIKANNAKQEEDRIKNIVQRRKERESHLEKGLNYCPWCIAGTRKQEKDDFGKPTTTYPVTQTKKVTQQKTLVKSSSHNHPTDKNNSDTKSAPHLDLGIPLGPFSLSIPLENIKELYNQLCVIIKGFINKLLELIKKNPKRAVLTAIACIIVCASVLIILSEKNSYDLSAHTYLVVDGDGYRFGLSGTSTITVPFTVIENGHGYGIQTISFTMQSFSAGVLGDYVEMDNDKIDRFFSYYIFRSKDIDLFEFFFDIDTAYKLVIYINGVKVRNIMLYA